MRFRLSRGRTGTAALAVVGLTALTACSGSSVSVSTGAASPTSPVGSASPPASSSPPVRSSSTAPVDRSVTLAQGRSIMARYDTDNNAAIQKAEAAPYDEHAWSAVDIGPVRATDTHDTRISALEKSKVPKGYRYTHRVSKVYGSLTRSSDGQAPIVLLAGTERSTGGKPGSYVSALVRTADGWREWADVGADTALLPAAASTVPTLTKAQRQAAANSVPAVVDALQLGETSKVTNPGPITSYRKALHKNVSGFQIDVTPRPWGTKKGTDANTAVTVGTPALRLTRVGSVTLGMMTLDASIVFDGTTSGKTIQLSKSVAKVEGNNGKATSHLVRRNAIAVLVQIPDHGKPKVLGVTAYYLIP